MAKVYEDTPTWNIDVLKAHHLFTGCSELAIEKRGTGKTASAKLAKEAGTMRNMCSQCVDLYKTLGDCPSKEERVELPNQ